MNQQRNFRRFDITNGNGARGRRYAARIAAERIRGRMQLAAQSIIEVGRELIEQKAALGHGNFEAWHRAEFDMSPATASRYMNVSEQYGTKSFTVKDLSPTALYSLSSPSTPPEVREQIEARAEAGENSFLLVAKLATSRWLNFCHHAATWR